MPSEVKTFHFIEVRKLREAMAHLWWWHKNVPFELLEM